VLNEIDQTGEVVTAGALHTTRNHATYLHQRGTHLSVHRKEKVTWHATPHDHSPCSESPPNGASDLADP
jgi:hypothetical protein